MKIYKDFFLKIFTCLVMLTAFAKQAHADHLKGGWIKYEYLGASGAGYSRYSITVYQYISCASTDEQIDQSIFLGIFDRGSNTLISNLTVPLTNTVRLEKNIDSENPCINPKVPVCYLVESYNTTVSLKDNNDGYSLAMQRCCRIPGIINVFNSDSYGLTYTVTIPGVIGGTVYRNNSSPVFDIKDTVLVCYNSPLELDFHATDADGDSLSYFFCSGLTGGSKTKPQPNPPGKPPYNQLMYNGGGGYSGVEPLGTGVTIDNNTGLITGIAPPDVGTYVVSVCVYEYRNGVFISQTRKEIHVDVGNCKISAAKLNPEYITCDGYDFTFFNQTTTDPSFKYYWDFGVPGITTDTSTIKSPMYIYPDTGYYTIQLKVANTAGCEDSATSRIGIFPGFIPGFSINGSCILNPYSFIDKTTTKYGYVDTWKWNFGDGTTLADTSHIQFPTYTYPDTGTKTITLIVSNSKGCVDTASKDLKVNLGPDLFLGFKDTLICSIDTLKLNSSTTTAGAQFTWSPFYNLINMHGSDPFVFPKVDTTYQVNVSFGGCTTTDSVRVRVIDNVFLSITDDTSMCLTDTLQLNSITNALYFNWSPSTYLSNASAANPYTVPLSNIQYILEASVGKCNARDTVTIKPVPYPSADAGADTSICFGKTVKLNADITGSEFTWSPVNSLLNSNTLQPTAGPQVTTAYILSVTDTLGCPKPRTDTITVVVIPPVQAYAGPDQNIVINQPVQLNADGAGANGTYIWSPPVYLNDPAVKNPVATLTGGIDTIQYVVKATTKEGCAGYDSVVLYAFETLPDIFIPSAFTPNGDGLNDRIKPILAGIKDLIYFRIYNRWGNLMYSANEDGPGWDGSYGGQMQPSGTYVYIAHARDYNGKLIERKGTIVLIR